MNASVDGHALIIGIGNPLRRDDGLGWVIAQQLAQDGCIGCDIRAVHQLTPELAQQVATAERVIIVDASRDGQPGELHIYPLALSGQALSRSTHTTTPEELAILAQCLYGRCAPITIVTMAGEDFSVGEQFSSVIASKTALISEVIRQLLGQ